jgi:CRISPR/Cas system CMR-associated protein Cmr5 small subunit
MQNLDQLRAAHAIQWETDCNPRAAKPKLTRADVAKLPAMILTNGLLGAFAFACEPSKEKRAGLKLAVAGLANHLARPTVGIMELTGVTTPEALATTLAAGESLTLQRATVEGLAYLSYLKRYAPKKEKHAQKS